MLLRALCLSLLLSGCPMDEPDPGWVTSFEAAEVGWLLNVGGSASDDLYAVGGEPELGAMMHFGGSEWSEVELPSDTPLLNWIHAFDSDDVFAVGNDGTILHYDGSEWTTQSSGVDRNLWGVWGADSNDVWAVGGNGREEGQATVLRYDGSEWTQVDMPELMRASVFAWFKVWGTAADNVWIVGQRGAVLHWDGNELQEELVGTAEDLISLWGTDRDNIVLVGGRSNGVAAHWNGSEWRAESLSPLPGLNGVWMREPGIAHVVGVDGTSATVNLETFESEEQLPDTRLCLHAVFSPPGSNRLFTVGGSLSSPAAPFEGVALERNLLSGE